MSKYYILGQEIIKMTELKTWATPRLLRFYKSIRKFIQGRTANSFYDSHSRNQFPVLEAYVDNVRALLNTREHVNVAPKLGRRQKAARKKLQEYRKKHGYE